MTKYPLCLPSDNMFEFDMLINRHWRLVLAQSFVSSVTSYRHQYNMIYSFWNCTRFEINGSILPIHLSWFLSIARIIYSWTDINFAMILSIARLLVTPSSLVNANTTFFGATYDLFLSQSYTPEACLRSFLYYMEATRLPIMAITFTFLG